MVDKNKLIAQYLKEYKPTVRERLGNATYDIARALGFPHANRLRNDLDAAADFVPVVGDALGVSDAYQDYKSGNYLSAAANMGVAAVGALPGVGDVAAKALKALPSSSSLSIPMAPTVDLLSKYGRFEPVPLSMARGSQPKMDWDKFNSRQYGEPMFKGFEDAPVAVMKRDGEYILYDGHHRTVSALNEGRKDIPMYVINADIYDPQNAGKVKPALNQGLSDEDLLRELGL